MTEKRFSCEVIDTDLYRIETITDNFEMNTFDDVETVTELLNKFSEENKKLKAVLTELKECMKFDVENGIEHYSKTQLEYLVNVLEKLEEGYQNES